MRLNYYSLCAILQALRETSFNESRLPHLFILIDHSRNWAPYRQLYEVARGLPFLLPHIRQLKHDKEKALYEIYSFILRKPVLVQGQELDRKELVKKPSRTTWAWATIKGGFSCLSKKRFKESGAPGYA